VALFGIALVPVFNSFSSIYDAHGAFTAAVTPPLVVTLMFSLFWKRFTSTAALWTLIGGLAAMGLSLFVPEVIRPFAHGVPAVDVGEGFLSGMKQYKFMRACYGLSVCVCIAFIVTGLTKPKPTENQKGLVWSSIGDALRNYKGSDGSESAKAVAMARLAPLDREDAADALTPESDGLPPVVVSRALAQSLQAKAGDPIYLTDTRWWLGGLRSAQVRISKVGTADDSAMEAQATQAVLRMVSGGKCQRPNIKVVRWY
jgi:SSS family solute:Na+ symporter